MQRKQENPSGLNASIYDDIPCYDDVLRKTRFTIFHVDVLDDVTISRIDKFNSILAMLASIGVVPQEIVRANVSSNYDMDLIDFITQKCGGSFRPPVVFMGNKFLGEYDTLYQLHQQGKLKSIIGTQSTSNTVTTTATTATTTQTILQQIQQHQQQQQQNQQQEEQQQQQQQQQKQQQQSTPPPPPQLGYLSTAIEVAETVAYYISPFSYIRNFHRSPDDVLDDEKKYREFEVIYTNWYGRDQRRKLRFYSNCFQRIHPLGDVVRATHKFSEIQGIEQMDVSHVKIIYKDGSPDWICAAPEVVSSMLLLLQKV